ncbi:MAG: 16S rRNA (uracil(1498)-N(3))-methyltransferase [Treponema sp.]|jgi:RsmE family RNA methyltransferase|nr:16S rRNA (uracil(1498)-N(3))-methyltransferase [Treponema sp.]
MNLILFEAGEIGRPLPRRDKRAEHLIKVLRKKAGDTFDAGIAGGALGKGTITETGKDTLSYTLELNAEPPPRTPVRLLVGFPRPIQLRRLLRDCANLGLEAVDLAGTELGEKSYRDTTLLESGGARAALLEGAVQARDTRIPVLGCYRDVAAWLSARPWLEPPAPETAGVPAPETDSGGALLLAADNIRPRRPLRAALEPAVPPCRAVLAVGSERGWSDHERELLEAAGFERLSLGSRALRTETACLAALALIMEKMGLLG